jgi:folate-binding protein YgfZ
MVSAMLDLHVGENASVSLQHGGADLFAVRTTDSGTDITRIIVPKDGAAHLTEIAGSLPGARWIGLTAYEGFRIARGIPACPGEINNAYNPLESGLRDSISFNKGCYIGQEVIARLDTYGKIKRHLARVGSPVPLPGPLPCRLLKNGTEAGNLTSMAEIPFGGRFPGLAILRNDIAAPGEMLDVSASGISILVADTSSGT